MQHECPGQFRQSPDIPEDKTCPACGEEMEVWTHDKKATCPACSKKFKREELK